MRAIISVEELSLLDSRHLLFDARSGKTAYLDYQDAHLSKAIFVDLNTDLASVTDPKNGGRHPLPSLTDFGRTIGKLGISPNTHVIVYDDHSGANAAARFWWMLRAIGHDTVQVLDGGFKEAVKSGYPIDSGIEVATEVANYQISNWLLPIAGMKDVEANTGQLIDVRSSERFLGIEEPIDLIAGHIPSAINIPFGKNLSTEGTFLNPEELRSIYTKFDPNKTTVHCGSGVTACHTLLAFAHAELPIPKLYVGSWSEWSRNEKPMILKA